MRKVLVFVVLAFITIFSNSINAQETTVSKAGYDELADPAVDLKATIEKAIVEKKRILLEIGGEWCSWCHALEKFIHSNEDFKKELFDNFIVLKVNYSKNNKNEKFLSQYPKVAGYPHIFILESDGEFLHSQNTGDFESGKGYDKSKLTEFVNNWKLKK